MKYQKLSTKQIFPIKNNVMSDKAVTRQPTPTNSNLNIEYHTNNDNIFALKCSDYQF